MKVKHWRIYCNTESLWTDGYLNETYGPPVRCFEDAAHSVNLNSCQILDTVSNTCVHVREEDVETGGHFKVFGYKITCPVGVSYHDYVYKHDISVLCIELSILAENTDDVLDMIVGPDTIVGVSTANVGIGEDIINVSQDVINNAKIGFSVSIQDGPTVEELGKLLDIDYNSMTITVETQSSVVLSSGSIVRVSINIIDDYLIGPEGRFLIGQGKIGASYVPKNTIIRVKYKNIGLVEKKLYSYIECLY